MCPVPVSVSGSGGDNRDSDLAKLRASRAAVAKVLETAGEAEAAIDAAGDRIGELLSSASRSSASGLQSKAVAARALAARIDRAVAPSAPLLAALRRVSSLARDTAHDADAGAGSAFVERVDRLRDAIEDAVARGDEAVRKVEEAVGFLGRTGSSKAAGRGRVRRLTEAASALRAVYEAEAEQMRFEGPLDDALLRLQDLFEALLLKLKHAVPNEEEEGLMEIEEECELGTEEEVDALARMARTLAANDCLDICVDIYVKARYRRAAKAMMRLDPAYLKAYTAEAIDAMEWEALESAMALWSPHFHVAVASVLSAERRLCERVMGGGGGDGVIIPPAVWPECFAKIAARIAAAFFRFADGVAAAAREPQRLFKLLDMADAVAREGGRLDGLFSSEPETTATLAAIRERASEVGTALARAAAAVFYEFGLRVETHNAVSVSGSGADVPKIVRYAVNYLKCLASDDYRALMDAALRAGAGDEDRPALAEAAASVLEALHRHVEAARRALMAEEDPVAGHVMAMNAYWYIYMRARGTDLARLVGEDAMKRRYKSSAEEAAWEYQDAAWTPLVRILTGGSSEAREKAAAFAAGLEERARRHGKQYKIPDADLRAQIRVAVTKAVRGAYAGFVKANEKVEVLLAVDVIERKVGKVFDEMGDGGVGLGVGRARSGGGRGRRESRGSGNLEGFDREIN
ncbi:exocyst complex component EXO70A1 [Brachypodium distachyon]|uniref:Exocyst subunit Exo70 family protein n=1 Tax=Brachypodium distachyon TaxID=15368 RepID=I1I8N2_BRADI|nr:exocyst complex component EXO70A1 [Brachypodium distachyon]KQJ99003.1 hypothetical protein BRADI_3g40510v3 [Brachypodium distachyon]|eukprot:XP_003572400.1 exocyst complex component EXO70A1 [Brachypodium distachyon]